MLAINAATAEICVIHVLVITQDYRTMGKYKLYQLPMIDVMSCLTSFTEVVLFGVDQPIFE